MPETSSQIDANEGAEGKVDHLAAHSARQHLLKALDLLEDAENSGDLAAQASVLGLVGRSVLEAASVIAGARREVNRKRGRVLALRSEDDDRDGVA